MDKKVTEAHVTKIAALLSRWKVAAKLHVLGLDDEIAKGIEDRYRNGEDQQSEVLMKWVRKQGPRATYGILYDVLQEMEEDEVAEMVMKLTKDIGDQKRKLTKQSQRSDHYHYRRLEGSRDRRMYFHQVTWSLQIEDSQLRKVLVCTVPKFAFLLLQKGGSNSPDMRWTGPVRFPMCEFMWNVLLAN
ncbi:hypothetical protein EMCRGX_G000935 [Ephydatia muelleri]